MYIAIIVYTTTPIINCWTVPKGAFFVKVVLSVQIVREGEAWWHL